MPPNIFERIASIQTSFTGAEMKGLRPYLRRRRLGPLATSSHISYTPDQIASLYQFPQVKIGTDPTIAIIELGGGFVNSDIQKYFAKLNLPVPDVQAVSVAGGANTPGKDTEADGEVMLDILVAAAAYSSCTGSSAKIRVFFSPDQNFPDAIKAAAGHDSKPVVCSISWGAPENRWTATDIAAMEAALSVAAKANMTVLAAAGDNGSGDGERGHHVDYPASSPQVLGCGGTTLRAAGNLIHSESTWNDGSRGGSTGGGYSGHFERPAWQSSIPNKLRGVPDIAGNADPYTGYVVIVDGQAQVIGGTSAVAPLMSALVALIAKKKGKPLGSLNALLYQNINSFRDILLGNNGAFAAGAGWDATTGLGVPLGSALASILG
jgi:kumamolisin